MSKGIVFHLSSANLQKPHTKFNTAVDENESSTWLAQ